ncbi:CRISPR-associated protein Cas5 [Thermococcus alcaliphilus]|uniref:CRISPR-associated protein Cas5 n=1 Tax=Thermococcus alcaliphilus TaxID=139207 RepID=UPI00209060FA|nr:CRISPR-associated protein Cas5 [Thermococcus alcaliphilus]MCO6040880.1 CRISPR-associated protein Cas5 [Thermococcus alcaliphilus]
MRWLKLVVHFPSFYSYRIPEYSSQYALTLPLIAPSTVKLAIVSTAIRISGKVSEGKMTFNYIRDAKVGIKPPREIAINSVFVKRLKKKKDQYGFQQSFGVREYVHFSEDVEIYLGLPDGVSEEIAHYARNIRYFGTSDSLAYVKRVEWTDKPEKGVLFPVEDISEIPPGSYIYPVKDFSSKVTFEQINPYSPKSSGKPYKTKYYPLKLSKPPVEGSNWKVLFVS